MNSRVPSKDHSGIQGKARETSVLQQGQQEEFRQESQETRDGQGPTTTGKNDLKRLITTGTLHHFIIT